MSEDVSNRLQDRMPWFLGAVIGLSFLVLMLVFRSVLVPAQGSRAQPVERRSRVRRRRRGVPVGLGGRT